MRPHQTKEKSPALLHTAHPQSLSHIITIIIITIILITIIITLEILLLILHSQRPLTLRGPEDGYLALVGLLAARICELK